MVDESVKRPRNSTADTEARRCAAQQDSRQSDADNFRRGKIEPVSAASSPRPSSGRETVRGTLENLFQLKVQTGVRNDLLSKLAVGDSLAQADRQ